MTQRDFFDGHCVCCGQRIRKLNPHRMCKQKVAVLELLGKASVAGMDWVKVLEGSSIMIGGDRIHAPYRARAHASRLEWFGLAEHGETRSGLYRITKAGFAFLLGEHTVPATIYCKDGLVVERDTKMVGLNDVCNVVLDKAYWDNYRNIQK